MKKIFIFTTIISILSFNFIYAEFSYPSMRYMGMGNVYTASSDDENGGLLNPAGLANINFWHLRLLSINPFINQNIFATGMKGWDLYNDEKFNALLSSTADTAMQELLTKYSPQLVEVLKDFKPYAGMNVPVPLAWTFRALGLSWGINIYNKNDFSLKLKNIKTMLDAYAEVNVRADVVGGLSLAKKIKFDSFDLNVGLTGKGIVSGKMDIDRLDLLSQNILIDVNKDGRYKTAEGDLMYTSDTNYIGQPNVKSFDSFAVLDEGLKMGVGFAADVGIIVDLLESRHLHYGLLMKDISPGIVFDTNTIEKVPFVLSTGFSYDLPLPFEEKSSFMQRGDLRLAVDVQDIFAEKNFFLKLNVGVELGFVHIWNNSSMPNMIYLRAGLHQGYPTFGVTGNLKFVRFNYTTFTREEGTLPGMNPNIIHYIELLFII